MSKLCDLIGEGDSVTSVAWSERVSPFNLSVIIIIRPANCIILHVPVVNALSSSEAV